INNNWNQQTALIDSGAQKSFIDENLIKRLNLKPMTLRNPFNITLANGTTQKTIKQAVKITMKVGDKHQEGLFVYITNIPNHGIILGLDWMRKHQPHLDFNSLVIDFNSLHCNKECLVQHYMKTPHLLPIFIPHLKVKQEQPKIIHFTPIINKD